MFIAITDKKKFLPKNCLPKKSLKFSNSNNVKKKITIILIKKEFGIIKIKATAIPVHKQFYVLHYYHIIAWTL